MENAPPVHLQELLATAVLLVGASAAAIVLSRRAGLGTVLGLLLAGGSCGGLRLPHRVSCEGLALHRVEPHRQPREARRVGSQLSDPHRT